MAMIDQHLAYFDAIVVTFNLLRYFLVNFEAMKDVMVVWNTAVEDHLFAQPFQVVKNILDNYLRLRYVPSKQDVFLLRQMPPKFSKWFFQFLGQIKPEFSPGIIYC